MTIDHKQIERQVLHMKRRFTALFLTVFVVVATLCVSASATRTTITLPENYGWVSKSATRSGSYSYTEARCHSVYPTGGGADFFGKIRAKVTDTSNNNICDKTYYTLDEGATSNTKIYLEEGELDHTSIRFKFCGNSNAGANADVTYLAK